ncbi:CYFA0S17e01882g1_1 [Cyberlindnera fabianii]|uniref:CYFA0S17e01882g1_1 n=1 Tax=Cyberlindnera fabianii TaxID=36022 RepID=A0A061B7H2_CYBFA|nr:CYFA0S17e01882g1_1 [Cyberlindnera fabianii]
MVDPREVDTDLGRQFETLTDDEEHQDEASPSSGEEYPEIDLEAEERALKARLAEIKRKKEQRQPKASTAMVEAGPMAQVSRTPSPKKPSKSIVPQQISPKNLSQRLQAASSHTPAPSTSSVPSYFLQALEHSENKHEYDKQERRQLIASRVYTFGSSLEIEPQVVDEKEYYSGQDITRRYISADALSKFMEDKKIFRLRKLFATVVEPDFKEPQYANWVVVGILSKKSLPRPTSDGRSKYVVFTLTDFKFNIQVTMFGAAVEKYNKLRAGDIIAILNPDVYVRLEGAAGAGGLGHKTFSLSIRHSGDCILEIGRAKHFGRCPSQKKDGTICSEPINKQAEQCCSYHLELRMRKTAGKRMEFQGSVGQVSPRVNGKKQELLLGRPDKRGGWKDSIVVTNESAPANDRISKARKYFSTSDRHQAFFNSEVTEAADIKKKQSAQVAHKKKRSEIELHNKLVESIQGAQNLKKFNSVTKDEDREYSITEKRALLKYAYGGTSSLGFDPSAKGASKGVLSFKSDDEKKRTHAAGAELSELAKKRKVDLGVSKEVIEMRRKLKKETDAMLKKIKSKENKEREDAKARRVEEVNRTSAKRPTKVDNTPLPVSFVAEMDNKQQLVFDFDSDDSDGLGIEPADPSAFKKFQSKLQSKKEAQAGKSE